MTSHNMFELLGYIRVYPKQVKVKTKMYSLEYLVALKNTVDDYKNHLILSPKDGINIWISNKKIDMV